MNFFKGPILICIFLLFVRRANTINCKDNVDVCDHDCTIQIDGSYSCICETGYEIQDDKKTCRIKTGEGLLIFSAKRLIHSYDLESGIYFPISENLQNLNDSTMNTDWIYWLDQREEKIIRSSQNFTKSEVIISSGLGLPEEIALDWTTGNIYYTDSLYKHIGVCNNDGSQCTAIISGASYMLRGLALYPQSGMMFWSDYGKEPHISTSGMDGKGDKPLITENLGWPNGLAIDYTKKRLYWVDAKLDVIESIRLDGSDRRQVLRITGSHPYSVAVFGNRMYWSDWKSKSIQSADKYSGQNRTTLISEVDAIYGIHIHHSVLRQNMSNPCETKPCSQLCLLAMNRTYACACIRDHELNTDGYSCNSTRKRNRILISSGDTLIEYHHNGIQDKPNMTDHRIAHRMANNIAYDPITNTVLATDNLSNSIFGLTLESDKLWKIMNLISDHTGGISFDYYGNNLYRSDVHYRTIEIYSLETGEKTVLHFAEEAWNILLIPEYAIMYVVFKFMGVYHIDKLRMSGVAPRNRIIKNLQGPKISLAYDSELERVFWADQGTGRIESISVLGTDRKLLRLSPQKPFGLVVLSHCIFWSIEGSKILQWTDKENTISNITEVTIPLPENSVMKDLIVIGSVYNETRHKCRSNNGDCSHVCLVEAMDSRICSCPHGMYLGSDMRTCEWAAVCTFDEMRCSDNISCINKMQRCNGIEDCPNGEDEVECYCNSRNKSLDTIIPD